MTKPQPAPAAAPSPPARRARKNTGRVTLNDLAKLVGVTKVTVSRALNTPELVSADTRERVLAAVRQTGYTPDLVAGSLASNRSRLIVALIPTIAGSVFQETVAALTNELAAAGYQLLIGQSGYDDSREDALIDAVIGRRPAGIVLTGVAHSEHARGKLRASGIPVVETWDLTRSPLDMLVGFSHREVGEAAARYLQRRGARRPAVVTPSDRRAQVRTQAFVDAFGAAAAIPVIAAESPASLGDGRRALGELLERMPDVDAIFCGADVLALGVLMEASHRGIAVPQRLRVLGYGDQTFAKDTTPALTTIRIDGTGIGKLAASLLIERIERDADERRVVDVGFTLVERDSA
ncbi:GntR family transcriptional regulator [Burkholderia sp. MSMB617WGS]|uniref:GntR family transcriptional regulator n=1 Tax=Burkholderia savannae TaxID=1637837 RepID=A0ABR5T626_9BURK|nr:GntR family transcriptional regulator [Burkholderia savannae]AOK50305.1 GntR family transcriptional regulator [Burkholderia sp. MSMB617WGS]KGR94233.1 bacterial regulatory s, lacI family protein [Burkholderia sp. ABCPW 111]KVG44777.1 GntR family transcriptional regulator [Burkholderia sp. MSMB0265]KVG86677.1 GntR family transcriptional regulator [Burkholderia sp. MSMB2040]KVG91534.1 GntR family transcriptional regulator [Burkholderia sp. MSMB2041]KVG97762.1 GntR family transcriptional regul